MNSKSTKKKLTGSIWALVVCFILLLGTTFAWFTDTASTNVNTIQAGNLNVALEMQDAQGNWVSAEKNEDGNSVTLNFVKAEGHENEAVLWEPGCEYKLPVVRVANKGNLALKYRVDVATVSGDEKLAEVLDVYLGENKVGTLKELLESTDSDGFAHGKLAAGEDSGALNISIKMQETAGNEYQGLIIDGIKVDVSATQDTVEYDSNGNQYDAGAVNPSSLKSLKTAIASGKENITFNEDITVDVAQNDNYSAIRVDKEKGAADVVTLDGTGTVTSNYFLIWARAGAKVIVNGGNYVSTGNSHLVYVNLGGIVEINGGTFKAPATGEQLFNMANTTPRGGAIIIKGGLYSRDPSTQIPGNDRWDEATKTGIKIEDGYKVVEKDIDGTTWYEVVPE